MNPNPHLTPEQRYTIEVGLATGKFRKEIALMLGVHPSTVGREIKRNSSSSGIYLYEKAQKQTEKRSKTNHVHYVINAAQWSAIDDCIIAKHSPEQITGRLKSAFGISVCHESIYQHILKDAKAGGSLYRSLRQSRKKRRQRRVNKEERRGCIKNRIGIEQRPEIVEDRSRVGDWEVDTIVSRESKPVLITAVERCSLATKIIRVNCKEAPVVSNALVDKLSDYKEVVLTITGDNGKEFAGHEQIAKELNTDFFFARPYHSWERGTNENTNGLIRQYFPKKTDFSKVTDEEVRVTECAINNRPRKSLGYRTAAEIFEEQTGKSILTQKKFDISTEELYLKCKVALAT